MITIILYDNNYYDYKNKINLLFFDNKIHNHKYNLYIKKNKYNNYLDYPNEIIINNFNNLICNNELYSVYSLLIIILN